MQWRPNPESLERSLAADTATRQAARSARETRVSSQTHPNVDGRPECRESLHRIPLTFFLSDRRGLDRRVAGFARANSVNLLEVQHEELAVTDLAGLRSGDDRLDDALRKLVADGDLHLHLRKEIDHVLRATLTRCVCRLDD